MTKFKEKNTEAVSEKTSAEAAGAVTPEQSGSQTEQGYAGNFMTEDGDMVNVADLEHFHPADVAEQVETLSVEDQIRLIKRLPVEDAAEALEEMSEHARSNLLREMDPDLAAGIVGEMSPDEAADILGEVGAGYQESILSRVEKEDAREIVGLLRFHPDSAGGVMNTEIVVLDAKLTVDDAIHVMRRDIEDKEIPYYAYIVDESRGRTLVGVLSLRDLLLSKPGIKVGDLTENQNLITTTFDVDKEQVAQELSHYNFLALPVVDYEGKLLGVVTHDDIIDIIHEEASEDMLGMVGAGQDETVDTPWKRSVRQRLPWLCINVINSAVAAWVVHLYEGTIAEMAILAALMHIVSNQAGNTGQQSLAVIIRQLALESFDLKKIATAVLRETKIGLANGLLIGAALFLIVFAVTGNIALGEVMALAISVNMVIGAISGATIPLILKVLGRDPAQASSIFLTTLTDSAGFFIFLGLASSMLL